MILQFLFFDTRNMDLLMISIFKEREQTKNGDFILFYFQKTTRPFSLGSKNRVISLTVFDSIYSCVQKSLMNQHIASYDSTHNRDTNYHSVIVFIFI